MRGDRFPRTMIDAFGCDARQSIAIERSRRGYGWVADVLCAVAIGLMFAALALAYFGVLTP